VLKTTRLSDGLVLPKGTFISMPTYSIARDPEFYENPLEFDPWRFYKLRMRSDADANRHQLTSTGPTNLAFGYGNAACPGRSFAAVEMKSILAHFIHNYDFCFPEGQTERPENIYVDERITPSPTQKVGFRLKS
jgi:cytochrome P450